MSSPAIRLLAAASIAALGCRAKGEPNEGGTEASQPSTPVCAATLTVGPEIRGSYVGSGLEPLGEPTLTVVTDEYVSPADRVLAQVELAPPFFAREFSFDDLCVDEGSSASAIRIACLQVDRGIAMARHLTVRVDGGALVASGDALSAPRTRALGLPAACVRLLGLARTGDLAPFAATWGDDRPSVRCTPSGPGAGRSSIDAVLAFPTPPKTDPHFYACAPGSLAVNATQVLLRIPAARVSENLGWLGDQCGGFRVTRFTDANAVAVEASDMGTETRFVYQLGDHVYYTRDERSIASVEVPCGARVRFVVSSAAGASVAQTRKLRE